MNDTDFEVSNIIIAVTYEGINMMIKGGSEFVVEESYGQKAEGGEMLEFGERKRIKHQALKSSK